MAYATVEDCKQHIRGEDQRTVNDAAIIRALATACSSIDSHCGRTFEAGTSSARLFRPASCETVRIDDATSVTLVESYNGSSWTATTDYELEPLNGVVDGIAGWPYTRLRHLSGRWETAGRASVRVTAVWGWAAVPDPVVQATLHLTHTLCAHRDAPLGIAGMTEFGAARVPVDVFRQVAGLLAPYRRMDVVGAFA